MFIRHLLLSCFLVIQIYSILINFVIYSLLSILLLSHINYCLLFFVINFMISYLQIKYFTSLNYFVIFIVLIFNFIALIFNFIISNYHSVHLLLNKLQSFGVFCYEDLSIVQLNFFMAIFMKYSFYLISPYTNF